MSKLVKYLLGDERPSPRDSGMCGDITLWAGREKGDKGWLSGGKGNSLELPVLPSRLSILRSLQMTRFQVCVVTE